MTMIVELPFSYIIQAIGRETTVWWLKNFPRGDSWYQVPVLVWRVKSHVSSGADTGWNNWVKECSSCTSPAVRLLTTLGVGTESSTQMMSVEEALQINRSLYIFQEKEMSLLKEFPEKTNKQTKKLKHFHALRVGRNWVAGLKFLW